MTQEDKELLLKDLCARLPYGLKVKIGNHSYIVKGIDKKINDEGNWVHCVCSYGLSPVEIDFCKPYLFPMSSMTEEQKFEFDVLQVKTLKSAYATPMECTTILQWCYKNHIDIYGLIPMGLAIDATSENIY